jgi:hypothetical protein
MFVPFKSKPDVAFTVPVTARFPVVPVSVRVASVFASPSLKVRVLFTPAAPTVNVEAEFVRVSGDAPDNVTVPDASIVVAPATAPAFVIPPVLLFIPPVIEAPPPLTVSAPADVIVPVPVVEILPDVDNVPSSEILNFVDPADWTRRALPVEPVTMSFITRAFPVPPFVRLKDVCVARLDPNVKLMSRPVVVVIVFPASYAC